MLLPILKFDDMLRMIRDHIHRTDTLRYGQLTSSKDAFMMKRMVITGFSWPMRWMRDRAWASTDGFQCRSMRYARDATDRSNLSEYQRRNQTDNVFGDYPTAPHEMVNSMTLTEGSVWNLFGTVTLFFAETSPSNRV